MKWESGNGVVLYTCARVCVCACVFACVLSLGVSFQRSKQKGESEKGKKDLSSYLSLQTSCPACPHTLKHTCTQSHKLNTQIHTLSPFPSVIVFNMAFLCTSAVPSKWTITSSYNRKLMQIESGCCVCLLCSSSKNVPPMARQKQAASCTQRCPRFCGDDAIFAASAMRDVLREISVLHPHPLLKHPPDTLIRALALLALSLSAACLFVTKNNTRQKRSR